MDTENNQKMSGVEGANNEPFSLGALSMQIAWAISAAARLQGSDVDRLRLHDALVMHSLLLEPLLASSEVSSSAWQGALSKIVLSAGLGGIEPYDAPDPARLPAITYLPNLGWGVIRGLTADSKWLLDVDGKTLAIPVDQPINCVRLKIEADQRKFVEKPVFKLFLNTFLGQKKVIIEAAWATGLINILALLVSLYSMQVYDRVIPTQGYSTLVVLTVGVGIVLFFDILIKVARSHLMEHATTIIDKAMSRELLSRLLQIRLDQLPASVGSLSAQIRGYEVIRGFMSTATFYMLVDVPFGIFFILMIAFIGSPLAAIVPLIFLCSSLAFGFVMRDKIDAHAKEGAVAGNKKTGLLVEAIEGAETIKSGAGAWKTLSKWIDTNEEAMLHEVTLKRISEKSSYVSALLQQVSYISLIAVGAYLAAEGHMTMGALIACSILSGRALAPVAQIPGLIIQAAHSKASLDMLEKIFSLETDNHDIARPLIPELMRGGFEFDRVRFSYPGAHKSLSIESLKISPGGKVGVIGPIGSGKSTLLRVLTGMYRASEGRVLLDGLDIDHLSRHFLGEKVGYLQQDHRLFHGTLRENLLIGTPDPGDEAIKKAAEASGLLSLISSHPKGLELPISEGGKGLSGGQRQLVAFTRLLISHPSVWLLDEPTASMDSASELRCFQVLKREVKPEDTLVLVTHKSNMLALVDRIIVIADHRIVMDGPRDEIIARLSSGASSLEGAST